jgi:hypothetical protein
MAEFKGTIKVTSELAFLADVQSKSSFFLNKLLLEKTLKKLLKKWIKDVEFCETITVSQN